MAPAPCSGGVIGVIGDLTSERPGGLFRLGSKEVLILLDRLCVHGVGVVVVDGVVVVVVGADNRWTLGEGVTVAAVDNDSVVEGVVVGGI